MCIAGSSGRTRHLSILPGHMCLTQPLQATEQVFAWPVKLAVRLAHIYDLCQSSNMEFAFSFLHPRNPSSF